MTKSAANMTKKVTKKMSQGFVFLWMNVFVN
jgi:hypothetical protein